MCFKERPPAEGTRQEQTNIDLVREERGKGEKKEGKMEEE